jgi:hypothetical protein
VMNASLPLSQWPDEIVHEWGSILKAFFSHRSC